DEASGAALEDTHAAQNPAAPLADLAPSDGRGDAQVTVVDLSAQICPDDRCPPVLGDTYVYMDDNHMTKLFVEQTLTAPMTRELEAAGLDRKSTRLNSSHVSISYAVFCLKKKNQN